MFAIVRCYTLIDGMGEFFDGSWGALAAEILVRVDVALMHTIVDVRDPVLVLVREGPNAVGAADDVMALVELDVFVATNCWSVAIVAGEYIRA